MVILRDDQMLIGKLRAIDQFNNLVLHQTVERIYVGTAYGDIPRGILLVRAENVLLLGEYHSTRAQHVGLTDVGVGQIVELRREIDRKIRMQDESRRRFLREHGLSQITERERFQNDEY